MSCSHIAREIYKFFATKVRVKLESIQTTNQELQINKIIRVKYIYSILHSYQWFEVEDEEATW